jgi:hypothetical protein
MILRQWEEGTAFTQRGERRRRLPNSEIDVSLLLLLPGVSTGKSRPPKKSGDNILSIVGVT